MLNKTILEKERLGGKMKASCLVVAILVIVLLSACGGEEVATATPRPTATPPIPTGVWNCQTPVRDGDTLWGIALDYGVTLGQMKEHNTHLKNPNRIIADQDWVWVPCWK